MNYSTHLSVWLDLYSHNAIIKDSLIIHRFKFQLLEMEEEEKVSMSLTQQPYILMLVMEGC